MDVVLLISDSSRLSVSQVEPRSSLLYTAGSSTSLRIWDVNREQCVGRLHACDSNACVTSLASPWPGVGLVLIGDSLVCLTSPGCGGNALTDLCG
jgi:WD40 repeat protein